MQQNHRACRWYRDEYRHQAPALRAGNRPDGEAGLPFSPGPLARLPGPKAPALWAGPTLIPDRSAGPENLMAGRAVSPVLSFLQVVGLDHPEIILLDAFDRDLRGYEHNYLPPPGRFRTPENREQASGSSRP